MISRRPTYASWMKKKRYSFSFTVCSQSATGVAEIGMFYGYRCTRTDIRTQYRLLFITFPETGSCGVNTPRHYVIRRLTFAVAVQAATDVAPLGGHIFTTYFWMSQSVITPFIEKQSGDFPQIKTEIRWLPVCVGVALVTSPVTVTPEISIINTGMSWALSLPAMW